MTASVLVVGVLIVSILAVAIIVLMSISSKSVAAKLVVLLIAAKLVALLLIVSIELLLLLLLLVLLLPHLVVRLLYLVLNEHHVGVLMPKLRVLLRQFHHQLTGVWAILGKLFTVFVNISSSTASVAVFIPCPLFIARLGLTSILFLTAAY